MKIGLLSDSHDNVPLMEKAVRICAEKEVKAILFAGDLVAPFTAERLVGFEGPVHAIYGNNDGERKGLAGVVPGIVEGPLTLEVGGRKIVMIHDLDRLGPLEADVDVVVYGHTHKLLIESGPPLKVNPGEVGGWLTGRASFCVVNLQDLSVETVDMKAP